MSAHCDDCDGPLDSDRDRDSGGHYRDRCFPCLVADARDERHVEQCETADCPVCRNYWHEVAVNGGERP
jgi:hypothetical protein